MRAFRLGRLLLACPFLLLATSANQASAANKGVPVAGNQCKKKDLGKTVGQLRCTQSGKQFKWIRTEPAAPAQNGSCHPNYTPCVPIDSDVDCEGGKGNGPSYVKGPVKVIGKDEYDLDADKDGIGCE